MNLYLPEHITARGANFLQDFFGVSFFYTNFA